MKTSRASKPVKWECTCDESRFFEMIAYLCDTVPTPAAARSVVGVARIFMGAIPECKTPELLGSLVAVERLVEEGVWEKPEVVGSGPFALAVSELVEAADHLVRDELAETFRRGSQAVRRAQCAQWAFAPHD